MEGRRGEGWRDGDVRTLHFVACGRPLLYMVHMIHMRQRRKTVGHIFGANLMVVVCPGGGGVPRPQGCPHGWWWWWCALVVAVVVVCRATQNCPKLLSGPNEKMPLNSRTCQPDRCREGGPRQGAKGKDRDARGRQGGMNRGGRERVPPQRLKCCREWSSGTLAEQKMLTLVRQGQ